MMTFVKDLVEQLKDDFTSVAADKKGSAEFTGFLNTGCYMLNAILSGSLYGGVPNNKITAIAGSPATGKTFFALSVVDNFLNADPENLVVYYDTEAAITSQMMQDRGIDVNRVIIAEPSTIQEFRHHALKVLKAYQAKEDKPGLLMVLDSLGMLSTSKEMEDSDKGAETRDMTKAQIIKATFRVLTLHLARANVPLILTNHVYETVGNPYAGKTLSGGSGLLYAASTILMLGKAKETNKTTHEVIGNIIKLKLFKGRLSKENTQAQVLLSYEKGLDKYFGLLFLAEKYGIIKKGARQYELPDGRKVFGKFINENPEEVFTPDLMEQLEVAANKEFKYGSMNIEKEEIIDD